jgi:phosphohistidine phosphatase
MGVCFVASSPPVVFKGSDVHQSGSTPTSPDTDFHQVRKSLKRVRYLIDLDPDHLAGNISGLKERQKRFGHFQDLHVQMTLLDEVASQNLSDSQHHALSQLIDQLRIDQQQTRNKILTLEPLAVPVTSRGMDGG